MSAIDQESKQHGPFGDLEEQQYDVLYHSMDVPLVDIRKKNFKTFFTVGMLLLGLVVLLSATVQIPNYVQVPIVIENVEQDKVMMFNHSARVKEYLVAVGDEVKAGQRICKVSSPQIQGLISAIRIAENDIQALENHDSIGVDLQINNLNKQIEARHARIRALDAEQNAAISLFNSRVKALDSEIAYARTLKERNKGLLENGAISQLDYLESERSFLDKQDELALLEKGHDQNLQQFKIRQEELRETMLTLSNRQDELLRGYKTDRSKLQGEIALAKQNLELYYGAYEIVSDELVLLAPQAGKVTYCYPSNQLLQAGEILYRLEVGRGEFEAKGVVEANRIGYVRRLMTAKVMLETFPHYEWGSLDGAIDKVSASPDEEGNYSISVALTGGNPRISPLLQNGQTGTCSIIFERKSLFGYIFRDFQRVTSEVIE